MSKIIGFFDSGIGGLPYLKLMRDTAPDYCYKYVADSRNFPYGIKKKEDIILIVTEIIGEFICKQKPSVIVIACNTASVVALDKLRDIYSVPFIGVVPAIKPAAKKSGLKRIGLFATNRTVSDIYTEKLISAFASDCEVYKFADPGIVSFVENDFFNSDDTDIYRIIKPAVDFFIEKKVDNIILGCTHFTYLEKYFRKMIPEMVSLVDSREGVLNQALKILETAEDSDQDQCVDSFFVTSQNSSSRNYRYFADYFKLHFAGTL